MNQNPHQNRRDFITHSLITTAGVVAAYSIPQAMAGSASKKSSSSSKALTYTDPSVHAQLKALSTKAFACVQSGNACIAHCIEQLKGGAKEFTHCLTAAQQMSVMSLALAELAAQNSVRVKDLLNACVAAAKSCYEACQEHQEHWNHGMHLECKTCAECCQALIQACQELEAKI